MTDLDALERTLGDALRPDAAPQPHDDELLRNIVERVVRIPAPPSPRGTKLRRAFTVGGGTGIAIAVGLWVALSHTKAREEPRTAASQPATIAAAEPPMTSTVEVVPIESLPIVVPEPKPAETTAPHRPTAAEMFAAANDLRNRGRDAEAVDGYRALQREFATSVEANASHVMLGRVLLERRSDPNGALTQFDGYLAGPSTTLREEALIGRARSLDKLGRVADSRAAWKAVLDSYADSVYADEARTRLEALEH